MLPEEYSYHDGVGRFVISGVLGVLFPNLRKSEMKRSYEHSAFHLWTSLNDLGLTVLLIAHLFTGAIFFQLLIY